MGLDLAAAFGLPCGGLGADSGPSSWELMWHSVSGQAEVGSLPQFLGLL